VMGSSGGRSGGRPRQRGELFALSPRSDESESEGSLKGWLVSDGESDPCSPTPAKAATSRKQRRVIESDSETEIDDVASAAEAVAKRHAETMAVESMRQAAKDAIAAKKAKVVRAPDWRKTQTLADFFQPSTPKEQFGGGLSPDVAAARALLEIARKRPSRVSALSAIALVGSPRALPAFTGLKRQALARGWRTRKEPRFSESDEDADGSDSFIDSRSESELSTTSSSGSSSEIEYEQSDTELDVSDDES